MDTNSPPEKSTKVLDDLLREIRDARLLLEYAVAKGLAVSDSILHDIKAASVWTHLPDIDSRVIFERAYRDLAQFTDPVTAATLRWTSDSEGRRVPLLARNAMSEAKIWARKLGLYATLLIVLILGIENYNDILTMYYPADAESSGDVVRLHIVSLVLQSLEPFLYGALGAVTFLLKSAHTFLYNRSFDKLRIPEYYNRLLLGMIAGGAIKLFITEVATDDGQMVELSGAAIAFIAGYNSDLLFSTIERVSAALLPKVGIETVKRAGPDGQTSALVQGLLERLKVPSTDEERKAVNKLLDRLIR